MKFPLSYLVEIEYLGFRYSGWAKQNGVKTIHGFIDKTLAFVFNHNNFKTLGCSRTDKMVSAEQSYFQLFVEEELPTNFLERFNSNLPPDISAKSVVSVTKDFNIIKDVTRKTYHYYFSNLNHFPPSLAPFITNVSGNLDLNLMQNGANIFVGTHDFKNYGTQITSDKKTVKTIHAFQISEYTFELNTLKIPCFKIKITGSGFLRHQIRLMIGQLFELSKNEINLDYLNFSLKNNLDTPLKKIAPPSSLILHNIEFRPK